uniref:Uncharacterized protein n=1 Tax=Strigamia maritima TaxID=126957 RepID=T1IZ46_STRMM
MLRDCQGLENDAANHESAIDELNVKFESKRADFILNVESVVRDRVKDLQKEVEMVTSEIHFLEQKRNKLLQTNKNLESDLILQVSLDRRNTSNVINDSILINQIDALRDELNQLNSEIDKFKARDIKVINELNDMYLDENLIEISLKSVEEELSVKNKQIDELQCELQTSTEETDIDCNLQIFSSNAKSLFSEVEEERAEGITELTELKEKYTSLKRCHEDIKLKINRMSQTKLLFDSRLDVCKENYLKYLQSMNFIISNKNKHLNDELSKLEILYNLNKDKHSTRNDGRNKSFYDGMILTIEKSLAEIAEQIEDKITEEMVLFEKCLTMKQAAFRMEKEILYRNNKNSTMKIINDSLL